MSNEPINFNNFIKEDGVYILAPINSNFENTYLKVREKENRIYSDNELKLLPFASSSNPNKNEWNLRAKSFTRFRGYLRTKNNNLNILDLGCGNGWFCGQLSKTFNHHFYCTDVNLTELKQGRRVFSSDKLKFIYANIFISDFPQSSFDLIIINSAIQYFPEPDKLVYKLLDLIKTNGEIHILDSPFYSHIEAESAKKRTMGYYSSLGFPEMAGKYFHHTYEDLSNFNYRIPYDPQSLLTKLTNSFFSYDSPFPWICLTKEADTI